MTTEIGYDFHDLGLSLFTALFARVPSFWLFLVRDFCRSGCRQNFANFYPPPPSPLFFRAYTYNSLFNTNDSYLKSVRACKDDFGAD